MSIEKVPPAAGGVPTPEVSDEGRSLVADGVGGYSWQDSVAVLPTIYAVDVVFDNGDVNIPNGAVNAQVALEEAYKKIPATAIVKMPEQTGGNHGYYYGAPFIREDGSAVFLGSRWNSSLGVIFQGNYNSSSNGWASTIILPSFGRKIYSAIASRWGFQFVASTESSPRSELWVTGQEVASGVTGQVSSLAKVYTAPSSGGRIKKFFASNFRSSNHTYFMVRDDGKLYASGFRNYNQLGTGTLSDTREYGLVLTQSGDLTYAGNQKVTNVFSTGTSSWAEVVEDDTVAEGSRVYKLMACGHNSIGQLGINVTGATSGAIRNSVPSWTKCKKSNPSLSDMESVGGPFRKIVVTEDDPNYQAAVFVLTFDKKLFHAGKALGGGTNRQIFTLVASGVEDVAATGGTDGSAIYVTTDGSVYGLGYNENYCLGNGTTTDIPIASPVTIGPFNSGMKAMQCFAAYGSPVHQFFVRVDDGRVFAAGQNVNGSSGTFTEAADSEAAGNVTTWRQVALPEPIVAEGVYCVSGVNIATTYFLGESGTLYGAGYNGPGMLGIAAGDLTNTQNPIAIQVPYGKWAQGRWDFLAG